MKVYFIPALRGSHKVHQAFAKSVNATFIRPIPETMPYVLIPIFVFFLFLLQKNKRYEGVFLCEGFTGLYFSRVLCLFKKNVKIIYHDADPLFYDLCTGKFGYISRRILNFFLKRIDAVVTVSEQNAAFIRKYFKNKMIVKVAPPFMVNEKKLLRLKLGREKNNRLIFVGRLDEDKNIMRIMDVFERLREKVQVQMNILGKGGQEQMVQSAQKTQEGLHYIGYTNQVEEYFRHADFLIHLARYDPHPCVTLEAMASGVIPIISETTGTSYLLDRRFVLSLKMSNDELAKKILDVMGWKQSRLNRLRKIYRERVRKYTYEKCIFQFKKVWEEVLNESE